MKRKSQFSSEYLFVVALSILLIAGLFVTFFNRSFEEGKIKDSEYTTQLLAKAANEIYDLSPGSRTYVKATIPKGLELVEIKDNQILFKVRIFRGESDVFSTTKPVVYGDIPTESGVYTVFVEKQADGRVKIGALCLFKDYELFYDLAGDGSRSITETFQEENKYVTYLKIPMPEKGEGSAKWMCDVNTPCGIRSAKFDIASPGKFIPLI